MDLFNLKSTACNATIPGITLNQPPLHMILCQKSITKLLNYSQENALLQMRYFVLVVMWDDSNETCIKCKNRMSSYN